MSTMERSMTAILKYALSGPRKLQLVAKLVQGQSVEKSLVMLEFTPKKAAQILHKVIASAVSNATKNGGHSIENLYIQSIMVGKGPKLKRMRFASRSRIHRYQKYRSFVKVVLADKASKHGTKS